MSHPDRSHGKLLPVILLNLLLILISPACLADYLSELEAEAHSLTTEPIEEEASNWDASKARTDALSPNLNRKGFEENLQHSFVGTYTFFSRLDETDKELVFNAYLQNNDIQHITTLVRMLYKKSI